MATRRCARDARSPASDRDGASFLQLLLGSANTAHSGLFLLGILDPADELVARQWRDVLPGVERHGIGEQGASEVTRKPVHHPPGTCGPLMGRRYSDPRDPNLCCAPSVLEAERAFQPGAQELRVRQTVAMSARTHAASIFIARSPEELYDLVSDVTRMGAWSPVCKECWWDEGAGPEVGSWFTGRNVLPERTWETRSEVVVADRGTEFASSSTAPGPAGATPSAPSTGAPADRVVGVLARGRGDVRGALRRRCRGADRQPTGAGPDGHPCDPRRHQEGR